MGRDNFNRGSAEAATHAKVNLSRIYDAIPFGHTCVRVGELWNSGNSEILETTCVGVAGIFQESETVFPAPELGPLFALCNR